MEAKSMTRLFKLIITLCISIASISLMLAHAQNNEAERFHIVVNPNNNIQLEDKEMLQKLVKQLYLKQRGEWPDKTKATPINRSIYHPGFGAFHDRVIMLSQPELDIHWASLKQTKGDSPPRKTNTANSVYRKIRKDPGAFSFISDEELEQKPKDIKVLFSF